MKRFIAIGLILIILILPVELFADSKGSLSYDKAISLLNLNNGTIKKLQRAENDAYKQYQSNLLEAGNIDVNGFKTEYNGKEMYITYGAETRLMMTKLKELVPEQLKFSWEVSKSKRIITENSLRTALRGVFLGLYSTQNDLNLKQKQLILATEMNRQNQIKLDKGMITSLDMEESGYELLKAQKGVDAAKRNYGNAVRSFNQFVGLPSKSSYTQIIYEETLTRPDLKPVDFYVNSALTNRFEVVSIERQIALKELEKKITDTGNFHKISTTGMDSYERLLTDLEKLNVDLQSAKLTVTNEIKDAYVDLISTGKNLDNMSNTVKMQKNNYERMQARFKAGFITQNVLDQTEIGLIQIEKGYKTMLYDYNTKITRFTNSIGIGPVY